MLNSHLKNKEYFESLKCKLRNFLMVPRYSEDEKEFNYFIKYPDKEFVSEVNKYEFEKRTLEVRKNMYAIERKKFRNIIKPTTYIMNRTKEDRILLIYFDERSSEE